MNGYLPQTVCTPEQYHCNYQQIDHYTTRLLNSDEARKVTGHMQGIYNMLKIAPWDYWAAPGRLRVFGDDTRTAWQILCDLANTSSATLRKAIKWMAEQGVIHYKALKNGNGIFIWFNLAITSVRKIAPKQKNLRLVPASTQNAPASESEAALYEENSVFFRDIQDSDKRADARNEQPPAAQEPELHELPLFADLAASPPPPEPPAPVAPRPQPPAGLHLVPRTSVSASPEAEELRELVVQAVRLTEDTQRAVERLAERVPDQNWRDWVERSALPKMVRVWFAEWFRREKAGGRGQPKIIEAGASQPIITDDDLAEMEAVAQLYESSIPTKEPSS